MGICASCLGLNRHPSHDVDETDALLDGSDQAQYGALGGEDVVQPDEEELRREREEYDRITAAASDNMIDVSHPTAADLSHHFAHTNHERQPKRSHEMDGLSNADAEESEDEEAAWLRSVQAAGDGSVTQVKGMQSGALVMSVGQLREDPLLSTANKASQHGER